MEVSRALCVSAALVAVLWVPAPAHPNDAEAVCGRHSASVLFIGRVVSTGRYRLSAEVEIEEARARWREVEAELNRALKQDPALAAERTRELAIAVDERISEYEQLRADHNSPTEVDLTTFEVVKPFRDVSTPQVMMDLGGVAALETQRAYIVAGEGPLHTAAPHVIGIVALPQVVEDAPGELEFLQAAESAPHDASVYGFLKLARAADVSPGQIPLAGVRILVRSIGYSAETVTKADGSFFVTGVPRGHIEVMPVLPDTLAVPRNVTRSREVAGAGCYPFDLVAALNGRVRGRVVDRAGRPTAGLLVQLANGSEMGGPNFTAST